MTRRALLLIGVDGLRVDDALAPSGTDRSVAAPSLAAFVEGGRMHGVTMEVPTISGPGWSSILTGTPHSVHGVFDNSFHGHRLDLTTDFLTRAWALDPSRTTFAASSWPPLLDPAGPAPVIATRLDQQRIGRHRLVIRDGETYGYRYVDGDIAAAAVLAIRDAGPDASFVYLGQVDEAGHLYGGAVAEYRESIERMDAHLGSILAAVAARVASHDEDWLVGITTDHGHLDEGGHGGDDAVLTKSFLAVHRYGGLPLEDGGATTDDMRPEEIADLLLEHLGR